MPKRKNESDKKTVSYRLPVSVLNRIEQYAEEHNLTNTEAVLHFLRKGLQSEYKDKPADQKDIELLKAVMENGFRSMAQAIQQQPIVVQPSLPEKTESDEKEKKKKHRLFGWTITKED